MRTRLAAHGSRLRNLRRTECRAFERGAHLSRAVGTSPCGRVSQHRGRAARLVGQLHRSRQADRHESLLRREPQQSRWLQRQHRTAFDQSGNGPRLRPGFPGGHGAGLGRHSSDAGGCARHQSMGRGHRRQPRRNAGNAVGDRLSGSRRARGVDRFRVASVGTEHRVQRNRTTGDRLRSGVHRRSLSRYGEQSGARPDAGSHARARHVSIGRWLARQIRPRR